MVHSMVEMIDRPAREDGLTDGTTIELLIDYPTHTINKLSTSETMLKSQQLQTVQN
jgi:hypothetical protein